MPLPQTPHWWQKGIIYQIYPRSFQDSNGDGVGDLPGIISRLDYVKSINVDAIWLSPFYPSPMADFGYDIEDYKNVHPLFGTLEDFDRLVSEAHARDLKVIVDYVPNHTSDRHPWFLESRSSRDNPRRDWYIWRDPAPGGGPPNNWLSVFGGPAWEWDEATGQYYLHLFLKEQPDLNWRNPHVRREMLDVMRFWLDRGVDGFRVDVIWMLIKDDRFRDDPPNPEYTPDKPDYESLKHVYSWDRPEVHGVICRMRSLLDSYDERMMVGETYLPLDRLVQYYGKNLDECNMPFNFELVLLPWNPEIICTFVEQYEAALPEGAWPNWVLGNHDQHRVASRIGPAQAPIAQMLLLTLRGTPTCYYGDELGMLDVPIPEGKEQDPWGRREQDSDVGRDPERTPMQWDASEHAGFSSIEPWLPVSTNYPTVNVEVESRDPRSMLSFYRALAALRRSEPALHSGSYRSVDAGDKKAMAYVREHSGSHLLVVLNFSAEELSLNLEVHGQSAPVLLSTCMDRVGTEPLRGLRLRANEGIVCRLSPSPSSQP